MKILLTTNKTLLNLVTGKTWVDGGYYNTYLPLKDMGHDVYFWDTYNPDEPDYLKVVDQFQPDLIFCCVTGDPRITPYEINALEVISDITENSNIKTFNWFCDDTWRFDSFSSKACWFFNACSTPEPDYVEHYKQIGYENIIVGGWHTNQNFYPKQKVEKIYDITFIGQINNLDRKNYIDHLRNNGLRVEAFHGLSHEEMMSVLCQSKIGINFSKNYNGRPIRTQMKLRPFEIAAATGTMVLSEYHHGLEYFFDINKEIVCFTNAEEMLQKATALLNDDALRKKIALNGNKRFISEHSSHKRMEYILKEIEKI